MTGSPLLVGAAAVWEFASVLSKRYRVDGAPLDRFAFKRTEARRALAHLGRKQKN